MFEFRPEYKDVSNHPIIGQLRSYVGKPEFEPLFNHLTADENNNTRFLLRMELRRVAAPCNRIIDLRRHGIKNTQLVEFNSKMHYMDDGGRRVFTAGMKEFGRYTLGVFEDVEHYAREVRRARQQGELDDKPNDVWLQLVNFGNPISRDSDRMHFSTPLLISQGGIIDLEATSLDISLSGIQLQLGQPAYIHPDVDVEVNFIRLFDSQRNPWPPLTYQLISQDDLTVRLRLKTQDAQATQLIQNLIVHHQRRYKLDVRHLQETTLAKGFEQMLLNHSGALPLFIDQQNNSRFCLTTGSNRKLWYRLSKSGASLLPAMLSSARLNRILALDVTERETFFFLFEHHQQGKVFHFAAEYHELKEDGQLEDFLHFAVQKPGWMVIKGQLFPIDNADMEECNDGINSSDLTLPSEPLPKELQDLRQLMLLRDVTQDWLNQYSQTQPDKGYDPNVLAPYRIKMTKGVIRIAMRFNNMRIEPRYRYPSTAKISFADHSLEGEIRDFSTQGLCLQLNEPAYDLPDVVDVALPKFQKLSSRFDLTQLPYRVVHYDPSNHRLHLMIVHASDPHPAKRFFHQLINANQGRLPTVDDNEESFDIARALRRSIAATAMPVTLFLQKQQGKLLPHWLGVPVSSRPLPNLLSRLSKISEGKIDFENLMSIPLYEQIIRDWQAGKKQQSLLVVMDEDGFPVMTRLQQQLPGKESYEYLKKALERGPWAVWRLEMHKTPKPDLQFIQDDLTAIGRQALHRAKRLEADLWNTFGMIEVNDVTMLASAMLRLPAKR
ncbi:PilZ domain-containing protein [Gallaecimonas sp. GXIMD1310]|uniref:PilZ domain-containing protein n=1 Tax=Gallaecimonas sp. GXIMD1310 TaxID=3131926 RepID=UPI00324F96EE